MKHRPCGNCPWRKDAPREYWHPDHFKSIAVTCQGDGISTMLCHKSPQMPKPILCAGWAAVVGMNSIGLRIQAIRGNYNPKDLDTKGLELFENFDAMLKANKINLDEP